MTTPERFVWTPLTEAILRSLAYGKATLPEIAVACGCSEKAAKNKLGKLALPLTPKISEPVRLRVVHYACDGWKPTRIARQLNLPIELVEIHAGVSTSR